VLGGEQLDRTGLQFFAAAGGPGVVFVRRPGSDCVLTARAAESVADDAICLTEVQCRNLRVCAHELYQWERFVAEGRHGPLSALFLESWLLNPSDAAPSPSEGQSHSQDPIAAGAGAGAGAHAAAQDGATELEIDGPRMSAQLRRELFGHVVSDSELVTVRLRNQPSARAEGVQLVLRVTGLLGDGVGADAVDGEEESAEQRQPLAEHVWRGVVGAETQVLVTRLEPPRSSAALDGHRQPSTRFALLGDEAVRATIAQLREAPHKGEVRLCCSDGEWFPVDARLLKPCIALNRPVREALGTRCAREGADEPTAKPNGGPVGPEVGAGVAPVSPEVGVDVDTLSLDKVLLHLEAGLRGARAPLDIATAEQLRPVAAKLGYRALTEQCDQVLGDFHSRLRVYAWAEVLSHNERGGCWVVMDGMVLDLERWLPEHPGGETIIPQQVRPEPRALPCACDGRDLSGGGLGVRRGRGLTHPLGALEREGGMSFLHAPLPNLSRADLPSPLPYHGVRGPGGRGGRGRRRGAAPSGKAPRTSVRTALTRADSTVRAHACRSLYAQARGVDSTVWFELYHASRESFTYIREFYIGEIHQGDLHAVPMATAANGFGSAAGRASDEFMAQLRDFCDDFRIENSLAKQRDAEPVPTFKSF
jgi:cytochrome b involved in lipid metabolism